MLGRKDLGPSKNKFPIIGKSIGIITVVVGFLTLGSIYGMIGLATTFVISGFLQTLVVVIGSKTINYEEKV